MTRSDRRARILDLLRDGVTLGAQLARSVGVSERTLYRDIGCLRAAGVHIDGSTGFGGGYLLRPAKSGTSAIPKSSDAGSEGSFHG